MKQTRVKLLFQLALRGLALCPFLLWLAGCQTEKGAPGPTVALGSVPQPAIDALDVAARGRIEASRMAIETLLDGRREVASGSTELADAFGEVGRLYLAYDFRLAAVASFANAVRLQSDAFRWRYLLAAARQQSGDPLSAAADLESCLALRPSDVPTLLRLGNVLLELGRLEEAEGFFAEAAGHDPESAAAAYGLGRIAALEQDHVTAVDHFERTLELQPEATVVRQALGLALRRAGDAERARELLESAGQQPVVSDDPLIDALGELVADDATVYLAAGSQEAAQGNYEHAEAHFRRALELGSEDPRARFQLATVLGRQERHDEAVEALRAVLEQEPGHRDARFNLATALSRLGQRQAALEAFSQVLELDPTDHDARLRRALLADSVGRRELAREDLELLLNDDPKDIEALTALAGLEQQLGNATAAVGHFRKIQELDPRSVGSYLGVYSVLLNDRLYAAAGDELELGLSEVPGHPQMTDLLARLLATCPEPSVRDGGRAVELARNNLAAQASFNHSETLALALAAAGEFTAAREHQARLLEQATAQGAPDAILERLRHHLDLYRQNQRVVGGSVTGG